MTNLPSASVDAILKVAAADEFVKAMKGSPTPILRSDFNMFADGLERLGYEIVNLKNEKNGSFSINFKLQDGVAPEIIPDRPNWDPEIESQKIILFLNAAMFTEFPGGDKKVMVVKVINLPASIEEKDVAVAVEDRKLVMELKTVLEDYGKIKKYAELPDGLTVSTISTLLHEETLTVTVALDKPEPEEKPKSIISKIKGALARAWPACLAIAAKMGFDEITNDEAM